MEAKELAERNGGASCYKRSGKAAEVAARVPKAGSMEEEFEEYWDCDTDETEIWEEAAW